MPKRFFALLFILQTLSCSAVIDGEDSALVQLEGEVVVVRIGGDHVEVLGESSMPGAGLFLHRPEAASEQFLELVGIAEPIATGSRVTVEGVLDGTRLDVTQVVALEAPVGAVAFDPQVDDVTNVAVIPVNFVDATVACSAADLRQRIFDAPGSVSAYYDETTFGKRRITGDVYPPIELPDHITSWNDLEYPCRPPTAANFVAMALRDLALRIVATTRLGVDWSRYSRTIFVLPQFVCEPDDPGYPGTGGFALVVIPDVWLIGTCARATVIAHELGHAYGLSHAGMPGEDSTWIFGDYRDRTDIMGTGDLTHLNAPHKIELGILQPRNVTDANSNGTFVIHNLEVPTNEPQVLRRRLLDGSTGYHYVSLRQPIGFDHNLGANVAHAIHLHRWNPAAAFGLGFGADTDWIGSLKPGELGWEPTGTRLTFLEEVGARAVVKLEHAPPVVSVIGPGTFELANVRTSGEVLALPVADGTGNTYLFTFVPGMVPREAPGPIDALMVHLWKPGAVWYSPFDWNSALGFLTPGQSATDPHGRGVTFREIAGAKAVVVIE